ARGIASADRGGAGDQRRSSAKTPRSHRAVQTRSSPVERCVATAGGNGRRIRQLPAGIARVLDCESRLRKVIGRRSMITTNKTRRVQPLLFVAVIVGAAQIACT